MTTISKKMMISLKMMMIIRCMIEKTSRCQIIYKDYIIFIAIAVIIVVHMVMIIITIIIIMIRLCLRRVVIVVRNRVQK